jgi:hypothetical protein
MKENVFSPTEQEIIKALGKRSMKVMDITKKIYTKRGKRRPPNGHNTIGTLIHRINDKCKYNRLGWFIDGEGGGRDGKTVWVQTTKRSKRH